MKRRTWRTAERKRMQGLKKHRQTMDKRRQAMKTLQGIRRRKDKRTSEKSMPMGRKWSNTPANKLKEESAKKRMTTTMGRLYKQR